MFMFASDFYKTHSNLLLNSFPINQSKELYSAIENHGQVIICTQSEQLFTFPSWLECYNFIIDLSVHEAMRNKWET